MADVDDTIGAWIRDLRGRLGRGELAGLQLPVIADSDEDEPIEGHVRFLLDNLASVEDLPPEDPTYEMLLEYRGELLEEFGRLRELLG